METNNYEFFLSEIERIHRVNWWEWDLFEKPIGKYICSFFEQHIASIEALLSLWYKVDNSYILEKLSAPHHRVELYEESKFRENIDSSIEDMLPVVTYSLPNLPWEEELSDMRILRIEYGKAGMAPVD